MQVYKFLDKNFDQVRQDVLDLFTQSKNKVRQLEQRSNRILKKKCSDMYKCICLCPDGVKPLRGSCRGHSSAERTYEEEQHGHQKIPSTHCQQQVPTVLARAGGEDGEVRDVCWNWKCHFHFNNLFFLHLKWKWKGDWREPSCTFQMQPLFCSLY